MADNPQALLAVSLGLILFSLIVIALFIIFVHTMPGKIARKRGIPQAEVAKAQYNLDHATIVAPAHGYLVDLALRPGGFVRLKTPVATFVSTEDLFLLAILEVCIPACGPFAPDRAPPVFRGQCLGATRPGFLFFTGHRCQCVCRLPLDDDASGGFHTGSSRLGRSLAHPLLSNR